METFERFLLQNKAWAEHQVTGDKDFLSRLAEVQKPEVLWIGCSDSRVPPEIAVNAQPGEIFVHRNIANQVITTDFNSLSVLQYAVDVLKVKHVVVCGHYNCGGVKAAMTNHDFGLINKWLRNIKEVYEKHYEDLHAITDETARFNKLVELNVAEQIQNLAKTTIVQKAWSNRQTEFCHSDLA